MIIQDVCQSSIEPRSAAIFWNAWELVFQIPIRRSDARRIRHGLLHKPAWILKPRNGESLLREQHTIVPDRSGSINACDIDHRRIIVVACPYSHYIIRRVAYRPVIVEILRGTCFDGGRTNYARI